MNHSDPLSTAALATTEVTQLRRELQSREQLAAQLATELFRLIKHHPQLFTDSQPQLPPAELGDRSPSPSVLTQEVQVLRRQLTEVEQQIRFYQEQIAVRDREISRLREAQQDLSDRNLMLEQVIQELPEVYRQKFSERLGQVKAKMEALEQENHRLHTELQNLNYRLALQTRRPTDVELPNFPSLTTNQPVRAMTRLSQG